jgi:hypothetical protein
LKTGICQPRTRAKIGPVLLYCLGLATANPCVCHGGPAKPEPRSHAYETPVVELPSKFPAMLATPHGMPARSPSTDSKVQSIQVDIGRVLGLGTKVVAIGADKTEPLAGIKVRMSEAVLRALAEAYAQTTLWPRGRQALVLVQQLPEGLCLRRMPESRRAFSRSAFIRSGPIGVGTSLPGSKKTGSPGPGSRPNLSMKAWRCA